MSDEDEQHGGAKPNPVIDAFDRTNTHAYVILGPHPVRAENVRNFSRALGFTESGGKHLSKINTVLYLNDENVYFRALNPYCTHAIVYNRVAAEIFVKLDL
jgi:hypothetical protein